MVLYLYMYVLKDIIICRKEGHFHVNIRVMKCVILLECRYFNMKIIVLCMKITMYITLNYW